MMKSRFNFYILATLTAINLNAYDTDIKNYIDSSIEEKMREYSRLKDENMELTQRVDELEDSLEKVETDTLVDKVNFGLGFSTTVNNYDKHYSDGHDHSSNNLYTTKLMLNMGAKISDNMKFTGRLSMYKYWADGTMHFYSHFDNMQGRTPGSSVLFVERAFVDWKISDDDTTLPTVLTIGRQPSSDGPSHQFKANTTRKATYSALVFDGASDGITLTSSLTNLTSIDDFRVRFAYGKGYQNDQTKENVTNAFIGSDNSLDDSNVYGVFFEMPIFGEANTLFQIGAATMNDVIANPLENDELKNKNIGDVNFFGVMFEGTDIKDSGLDLFAHFAYSKAKPSKNLYDYEGYKLSLVGNGTDFSDKSATAFWLGGRYSFENDTKIGFEYNQGSKYWLTATQGSFDLLNKLATRGKAYEAYYIYPINRYSFLRFGGTYVDYDYSGSGWFLGEPTKFSDLNGKLASSQIENIKNIYLQFGLNF